MIIFIALLVVAAISAGVFIQTSSLFQQKALTTGKTTRKGIATHLLFVEINGNNGKNPKGLKNITAIVKLSPGSSSIKLDDLFLSLGLHDASANLKYKDSNHPDELGNAGFNTWTSQEAGRFGIGYDLVDDWIQSTVWRNLDIDLDLDGVNDKVIVCEYGRSGNPCQNEQKYDGKYLYFNISSSPDVLAPIKQSNGSILFIGGAGGVPYYSKPIPIGDYGFYMLNGTSRGAYSIDPNVTTIYDGINLNEDFDDDSKDDFLYLRSETNFTLMLSSGYEYTFDLGFNLSNAPITVNNKIDMKANYKGNLVDFGDVVVKGTITQPGIIDKDVNFTIIPDKLNQGYFTVQFLNTGKNHVANTISSGDVARIFFESPEFISESKEIRVMLLPKNGIQTVAEFFTPNVMVDYNVHLYP